jgi:hypothetical protein
MLICFPWHRQTCSLGPKRISSATYADILSKEDGLMHPSSLAEDMIPDPKKSLLLPSVSCCHLWQLNSKPVPKVTYFNTCMVFDNQQQQHSQDGLFATVLWNNCMIYNQVKEHCLICIMYFVKIGQWCIVHPHLWSPHLWVKTGNRFCKIFNYGYDRLTRTLTSHHSSLMASDPGSMIPLTTIRIITHQIIQHSGPLLPS